MKNTLIITLGIILCGCGGKKAVQNNVTTIYATPAPAALSYGYEIVSTYPHSTDAYTQGLVWFDGYLYEGTGQKGESRIRQIDLTTGKAIKERNNSSNEFGEGIVVIDTLLYQLTWTEGVCHVYDVRTFEPIQKFKYSGEGWGITTDGERLYMSDGSDKIYVRRASDFVLEKVIYIGIGQNTLNYINELEWIEGELWANVYGTNYIVRINPVNGHVTGTINLSGIQNESDISYNTDVLNGIAYDVTTKRIFVTGKNWNKLYEIKILN